MRRVGLAIVVFASFITPITPAIGRAPADVIVDRNVGTAATHAFTFTRVPSPVTDDAGAKAKFTMVDGEMDANGGSLEGLADGLLPRDEDEPGANFFFNAGTSGGRFRVDLGGVIDIAQVHTYSWHANTRGPQMYTLYASDGTAPAFNPAPKSGVDPVTVGWTRMAAVDTTPKDPETGGQYGVSIQDRSGSLGKYRYLLFECAVTEVFDDYGNTFYSEIDVIARSSPGSRFGRR